MPYRNYGELDPEDVDALVAYVRTLKPQPDEVPDRSFQFPMQILVRTLPQPARFTSRPDPKDRIAYGGYLARTAGCAECHATRNEDGSVRPGMEYAGGMAFRFPEGGIVRAPNITPDADTGIGMWSEAQFVTRFKVWQMAPDRVLSDGAALGQHRHAVARVGRDDARRFERDLRLSARPETGDSPRPKARPGPATTVNPSTVSRRPFTKVHDTRVLPRTVSWKLFQDNRWTDDGRR